MSQKLSQSLSLLLSRGQFANELHQAAVQITWQCSLWKVISYVFGKHGGCCPLPAMVGVSSESNSERLALQICLYSWRLFPMLIKLNYSLLIHSPSIITSAYPYEGRGCAATLYPWHFVCTQPRTAGRTRFRGFLWQPTCALQLKVADNCSIWEQTRNGFIG